MKNLKRLIRDLTLMFTLKHVDLKTYPWWATFGAGILLFMLVVKIVYSGAEVMYKTWTKLADITSPGQQALVNQSKNVETVIEPDQMKSTGGPQEYVFTEKWKQKDDNSIINEDGSLSLIEGKTSSIYEYLGVVPARSDYGLKVVSRGVYGPNTVVGRPEFYEVTIGDMSKNVVTLKATDKLEGTLHPVEEAGWLKYKPRENSLRPRTENCEFASGEEIKIDFSESFIESTQKFKIDVTVVCNNGDSDTFTWMFIPPPKWIENVKLYLAIIDDVEGTNGTKVDFLEPIILQTKSE